MVKKLCVTVDGKKIKGKGNQYKPMAYAVEIFIQECKNRKIDLRKEKIKISLIKETLWKRFKDWLGNAWFVFFNGYGG
jgi:hypothetical protein